MLLLQHPQSLDGPLRGCPAGLEGDWPGIDSGLSQPEDGVSALPAAPGSPRGEALCWLRFCCLHQPQSVLFSPNNLARDKDIWVVPPLNQLSNKGGSGSWWPWEARHSWVRAGQPAGKLTRASAAASGGPQHPARAWGSTPEPASSVSLFTECPPTKWGTNLISHTKRILGNMT